VGVGQTAAIAIKPGNHPAWLNNPSPHDLRQIKAAKRDKYRVRRQAGQTLGSWQTATNPDHRQ